MPSLLSLRPDLPPDCEAVLQRALAKNPDSRYNSALSLFEALSLVLNESQQTSRLPETISTTRIGQIIKEPAQTDFDQTITEQNKSITLMSVGITDCALLVEEVAGTETVLSALTTLWTALENLIVAQRGLILSRSNNNLLASWGVETTCESDAEQAIHTALQMQSIIQEIGAVYLDDDDDLPLNIGINSGFILLKLAEDKGTLTGVGSTINIANRLSQNAFGRILITQASLRQVLGVFDIEEDTPLRMRGRKEPLLTYRVIRAKARAFKIDMRTIEGVETKMVGREVELKHLRQVYLDAYEEEESQVVTVLGEGGMGKSRLLYEFNTWLELRPELVRVFDGRATEMMRERPYALLRDIVSTRFQILDSDPIDSIKEKLEDGINDLLGRADPESAHLIGYLCGFDLSNSPYLKGILDDPQQIVQLGPTTLYPLYHQHC